MSLEIQNSRISLGAVSFLNSRPLLYGLVSDPRVALQVGVPSSLASRLLADEFDAALIPIVDVLRSNGELAVVSDACIACDGETMTVRVFSQAPPDRITRIIGDPDSHTSVVLAKVLWRELYDRDIEVVSPEQGSAVILPAHVASDLRVRRRENATTEARRHGDESRVAPPAQRWETEAPAEFRDDMKVRALNEISVDRACESVTPSRRNTQPQQASKADAVLLIGDKVVDPHRAGYAYEIDLGGAWRAHTGLPFVFAVWAAKKDAPHKNSRIQGFEDASARKPDASSALETAKSQWESEAPAEPPFEKWGTEASAESSCDKWEGEAPVEPSRVDVRQLREILDGARDAGVAAAASIALKEGPAHGWPVELAERYLTRCLQYKLTPRMIEGANLFARLAGELQHYPPLSPMEWGAIGDLETSVKFQ